MNLKEIQTSYSGRDMVKMFRRVDELTRENQELRRQLSAASESLELASAENKDLTSQLFDLQSDVVRQMTAARVLPTFRHLDT